MAFPYSNAVNASGSTFNDVRDQINIGRDHIIFNFSDMSSTSIASSMSGYSSGPHSAPNSATASARRRRHNLDYSSDESEQHSVAFEARTSASREARRKRIADEQKRRDELKDGYKTLEDELPVSKHLKSSKASLLSRGMHTLYSGL
jgi:hypothetical protein